MAIDPTRQAEVTTGDIEGRMEHYGRLARAGVGVRGIDPGRDVILHRTFRDGRQTQETLPESVADWTLATIPEREPTVARARICRDDRITKLADLTPILSG